MPFQKEVFVFYLQFLVDYVCFWKSTTICTLSLSEYLSSILQFQPKQKVISFSYNMDTSSGTPKKCLLFQGHLSFCSDKTLSTQPHPSPREIFIFTCTNSNETKPETLLGRHAKDGPKLYYKQLTAKTYLHLLMQG